MQLNNSNNLGNKAAQVSNLNALFITDGMPQPERLLKLNRIAIQQMKLLTDDVGNRPCR